jgi:hypothetical protein
MEEFRLELVNQIAKMEFEEKAFSNWLFKFDNMRDFIY